jgi:hypothetical protein
LAEGENPFPQIIGVANTRRSRCRKKFAEDNQDYNGKVVLFQRHHSRHVLRGGAPRQDRGTAAASDASGGRTRNNGTQVPAALTQHEQQNTKCNSVNYCKLLIFADDLKILRVINSPHYCLLLKKEKLRGFIPQANYTDQATVACRRS